MRFLWIAFVLALFQCSCGEEPSSTVSQDLIDELFEKDITATNDIAVENKSGGGGGESVDNSKGTDIGTTEDPTLMEKKPNVS